MLRVIFLGRDIGILEELHQVSKIEAVYFEKPDISFLKPRNILLRSHIQRRVLTPILSWNKHFFKKWHRTIAAFEVYDFARKHGIHIITGEKFDPAQILKSIESLHPDLGVVANFSHKIPEALTKSVEHGFINYHPSLLPQYRGPNPFERILLNNEVESGVTFHRIVSAMDKGNILAQEKFQVSNTDTIRELAIKSIKTGKTMLGKLLEGIEQGNHEEWEQDESKASCFSRLNAQEKKRLDLIIKKRQQLKMSKRT